MSLNLFFLLKNLRKCKKVVKNMDWIRAKDLPNHYPVSRRYITDLLRQFRAENEDGWIKDGKVMIVRKEDFERWWKQRSRQRPA